MRRARASVVAVLVVCLAAPAAADRKHDASEIRAERHYVQGRAYFKQQLWDKALEEYGAAYALSPRPLLLYHIGVVHEHRGDKVKALESYQRFVEQASPDEIDASKVRERIVVLKREQASAPAPAPAPAPARAVVVVLAPDPAPVGDATAAADGRGQASRWLWIGGGVALFAAGLALDLIPSTGDNYRLDALDLAPLLLYGAGVTGVVVGSF